MRTSREMRLISRPVERMPSDDDVKMIKVVVPDPAAGQVVVRNLFMSIDPGSLLRMRDLSKVDIPNFEVGAPMWSDAVGEVVESAAAGLSPGDIVWHRYGWRDYVVADASHFHQVDPALYPSLSHHLSFGLTAYVGLHVAKVRQGETFFVSSAAGGVGTMAGQVARLCGASRVIGSTGTPDKARYLRESLGFDVAFDYHDGIRQHLPDDLDVYFDNAGGSHLEAAIDALRPHGRAVLCGGVEEIRSGEPRAPRNILSVIGKRLKLQGFYTFDHPDLFPRFAEEFPRWVRRGEVVIAETIVDGLENGLTAVLNLLRGRYLGKVVLRI
ncbi:NADP-dependent oxidoreductase [Salinispora cortesiana]|uniref:NADP-dependent oxidoreductase n=1 Tax=Salinispora cortesiana TaxID=1305843 RepID=UPI0004713B6A|nr:NADP-dependent oxidoreductase [Salinispora cortesiana]